MKIKESENDFYSWLKEYAQLKHWKIAHFRPARVKRHGVEVWETPYDGDKGFLDVVFARNGVVILAELKSETGKVSPEQREWLEAAGGYLWRPSDRDEIMRLLA